MSSILTVLALAVSIVFLIALALAIWRGIDSRRWHSATAKIVASRVQCIDSGGDEFHEPHIAYRYNVNGTDYTGHEIGVVTLQYNTDRSARRRIARYPVGTEVVIHYNPNDPAESLLEPGPKPLTTAFALVLLLVLITWLVSDLIP